MDLDVFIKLRISSFGAEYPVALLGLPNDGRPVLAPDPRGPLAHEGIPLEVTEGEESVDLLAKLTVERGPSALAGNLSQVSEDEESPDLAMSTEDEESPDVAMASSVYLLCVSCSFLLLASASLTTFCS